ncbi:unnamed protein product, partial [Mesorhabditis belari]|uniref:C3H1-type domain-containing protein n=1 Tax=Mesorhabditis belari TaxID=2138241 RepID=A0AAF3EJL6_9BILA
METRMAQPPPQLTHTPPQHSVLCGSIQEKSHHITYLEGFRVESCPLFKQHQCQQHRPYTCFNWHFANQRRRKPVRRVDGSFNYSPDIYCDKYDENTGICPDGDQCPYLHRVSGDVERKYHLRYYKTAQCVHPTDQRGQCVKNGAHCAFAHAPQDLRQPQHDTSEAAYAGCVGDTDGRDRTSFVIDDPLWHRQDHVLSCYKTEQCRKPARLCRQGYACPFYHNSKDRRRQPAIFKYRSTPCPAAKTVDEWLDPELCEQGDNCGYCHTRTEQQFHPEIYKSTKCNDMLEHGYCPRAVFCAFAHHDSEMHVQRTPYAYSSQHSPKEHGSPDYRLGSPAALNGSMNGLNINGTYQSMVKGRPIPSSQAIPNAQRAFSTSRDDLMSNSYPKAPGFERGPLSPNYQPDQRNRTYSLNIGNLDMARKAALLSGQWGPTQVGETGGLAAASNLCRSDSGFHAVSSTMEELSLDLAPIDENRDSSKFSDLFSTSLPSPMRLKMPPPVPQQIPQQQDGPQPFHTPPFTENQAIFQQKIPMTSPGGANVFTAFPAAKHPHDVGMEYNGGASSVPDKFQTSIIEERLKEARHACETWRNSAEYYKMMADKAMFENNQLRQQLDGIRLQGGAAVTPTVDFTAPPPNASANFNIFGNPTDDVWRPLPAPDSPSNSH